MPEINRQRLSEQRVLAVLGGLTIIAGLVLFILFGNPDAPNWQWLMADNSMELLTAIASVSIVAGSNIFKGLGPKQKLFFTAMTSLLLYFVVYLVLFELAWRDQ
jgi:uncharacterized membrane protein YozB (DUF420 family)